jgi:hypothetical protein
MEPITQKEVDELKSYLWSKIDELKLENILLKVGLGISLILIVALIMATQYALTGSVI